MQHNTDKVPQASINNENSLTINAPKTELQKFVDN